MGISIDEAIENSIISEECAQILPKTCKCGCKLSINESIRWLECTSNNCKYILNRKIDKILNRIGTQLSEQNIDKLIDKLGIISHYQILLLGRDSKDDIDNIPLNLDKIEEFKSRQFYIYEIAEMCCDETIEKIARTLFYGFNSFDEVYKELEIGQIAFINERLGIYNTDSMAISLVIYNTLLELKEQFIFIESQLNVRKHKNVINIAFADNVLPFINRSEAAQYLDDKYDYTFCMQCSVTESTDILVRNSITDSNKNRLAVIINNKHIAELMNSDMIKIADINKLKDDELKPIGNAIYITDMESLIRHLDILKERKDNERS